MQNHFWSSEEIFFIGKKCKNFILTLSFFAKNILEFRRKKFGGGEKLSKIRRKFSLDYLFEFQIMT